ncbi:hypothetical protein B5F40_12355 [Gordonibacter sp. An230]|uniref:helix-turn-helix transcriptional regulator n=1 Tax=Gordonibacter sp. An230 TaxID=1965592 RepID=UPI000B38A428|nr:helix-turn-helix transcriptional regulator [Gordonibacter sp. An230]OUO88640.1 hypothetical protein B5F40_12355 [Gordonibacter sp. An230]
MGKALKAILLEFEKHRLLLGALVAFWGFHYVVFWSEAFAPLPSYSFWGIGGDALWIVAVTCNALALGAFCLGAGRASRVDFMRLSRAAAWLTAVGTALLSCGLACSRGMGEAAYFAGTMMLGFGTGLLMACLSKVVSGVTPKTTYMCMAASFAGGALLDLVVTAALVPLAARMAMVALPFAFCWVYRRELVRQSAEKPQIEETPSQPAERPSFVLGSLTSLVVVIGLSAGLMRGVGLGDELTFAEGPLFVGTVLVTGCVLVLFSQISDNAKPTLLFQIVVIVIAGAFVALALVAHQPKVAFALHTVGFLCFVLLVWFFCSYYAWSSGRGAWAFSVGLFANQAGQAAGSFLCVALVALFGSIDSALLYVSFGMVYLLFVAALVYFSAANRHRKSISDAPDPLMDKALDAISKRCCLTPREREIAGLVMRGDSRSAISEVLCVSQETVKSHTKHLYQKLGVHSRDALVRLVRNEAEDQML